MAEIKIEKTKTIWPWVVAGLIILAGIAYFLFFKNDKNQAVLKDNNTTTTGAYANISEVSAFIDYVDNDTTAMSLDHEYTHTALIKLADAASSLSNKTGDDYSADIVSAKQYADKITNDPMVTTHADNIKRSTEILSSILANLQNKHFPQLKTEAENIKSASSAIDTDELTLDQKKTVKAFFSSASVFLKKIN